MLNVQVQVPESRKLQIRSFTGGYTDMECNVPPNCFVEFKNVILEKNGSVCSRYGSRIADIANPKNSTGCRNEHLVCFKESILIFNEKKINLLKDGVLTEISGPNTTDLMCEADKLTCSDTAVWNDQLIVVDDACSQPMRIYCDAAGDLVSVTLGLPKIVTPPTVTSNTDEGCDYIYSFVYCYPYQVGTTQYLDLSCPIYVRIDDGPDFDTLGEGVDITDLPVFVSPPGKNYDDANIRLKIYRTTKGGTTYYEIGDIANGTTTFTDGNADSAIQNNEIIFNQDDDTFYDQAPPASMVTVTNDVVWYGGQVKRNGVVYKNRLYQALGENPSVSPSDWYIEFEGDIIGLSDYQDFPIVGIKTPQNTCRLYRVEGRIDIQGRGLLQSRVISEETTFINNRSITRARTGLYFWGDGGIFRTDGTRTEEISEKFCETYCTWIDTDIQRKNVYGEYDKQNGRIYWAFTSDSNLVENDKILVYDERHNAFSIWDNEDCFSASSLLVKDKVLYRGGELGYLYLHDKNDLTDPIPEFDNLDVSTWRTKHVPWKIKSPDLDLGDCDNNKWLQQMNFMGKPDTNQTFDIRYEYNGCKSPLDLKCVEHRYSQGWCTEDAWCDSEWCAGDTCYMFETRRFRCGKLRSRYMNFELCPKLAELECAIPNNTGTYMALDTVAASITKNSGASFNADDIGRTICIAGFNIPITGISADFKSATVDLSTIDGILTSGDYDYQIKGYPKNERIHFNCISITFCVMDDTGGAYQGVSKGGATG